MPRRTSRPIDRSLAHGEATIYEKAAVVMIAAIPMLAMTGYGAVDVWSLIPLSLLTVILVLLWTGDSLKRGEFRFSTSLLQLPPAALLALGVVQLLPLASAEISNSVISTSLTLDAFSTRVFAVRLFLLLLFFAAALTYLNGKRRVQVLVIAVIIFGAVMAFVGILQKLTSPDAIYGLRPTPQAIPFGPFVNQHHFAAFMEMTIGAALAMLLGGSVARDRKPLYLIALALMLMAAAMTSSRGGMIGIFAAGVFAAVASYAGARRRGEGRGLGLKMVLAGAAVTIVAVIGVIFLAGADPIVRGIGLQSDQADVTNGRLHFWSVALKIFFENPLIGAGLDAFGVAFTRFDSWNGFFRVEQAHNDYLQILADGGVVGFGIVAAFIFMLFKRGLSVLRNSTSPGRRSVAVGALAGCFGILVHSFFDFPLRTVSNSYFFMLFAVIATVPLGDERGEK